MREEPQTVVVQARIVSEQLEARYRDREDRREDPEEDGGDKVDLDLEINIKTEYSKEILFPNKNSRELIALVVLVVAVVLLVVADQAVAAVLAAVAVKVDRLELTE